MKIIKKLFLLILMIGNCYKSSDIEENKIEDNIEEILENDYQPNEDDLNLSENSKKNTNIIKKGLLGLGFLGLTKTGIQSIKKRRAKNQDSLLLQNKDIDVNLNKNIKKNKNNTKLEELSTNNSTLKQSDVSKNLTKDITTNVTKNLTKDVKNKENFSKNYIEKLQEKKINNNDEENNQIKKNLSFTNQKGQILNNYTSNGVKIHIGEESLNISNISNIDYNSLVKKDNTTLSLNDNIITTNNNILSKKTQHSSYKANDEISIQPTLDEKFFIKQQQTLIDKINNNAIVDKSKKYISKNTENLKQLTQHLFKTDEKNNFISTKQSMINHIKPESNGEIPIIIKTQEITPIIIKEEQIIPIVNEIKTTEIIEENLLNNKNISNKIIINKFGNFNNVLNAIKTSKPFIENTPIFSYPIFNEFFKAVEYIQPMLQNQITENQVNKNILDEKKDDIKIIKSILPQNEMIEDQINKNIINLQKDDIEIFNNIIPQNPIKEDEINKEFIDENPLLLKDKITHQNIVEELYIPEAQFIDNNESQLNISDNSPLNQSELLYLSSTDNNHNSLYQLLEENEEYQNAKKNINFKSKLDESLEEILEEDSKILSDEDKILLSPCSQKSKKSVKSNISKNSAEILDTDLSKQIINYENIEMVNNKKQSNGLSRQNVNIIFDEDKNNDFQDIYINNFKEIITLPKNTIKNPDINNLSMVQIQSEASKDMLEEVDPLNETFESYYPENIGINYEYNNKNSDDEINEFAQEEAPINLLMKTHESIMLDRNINDKQNFSPIHRNNSFNQDLSTIKNDESNTFFNNSNDNHKQEEINDEEKKIKVSENIPIIKNDKIIQQKQNINNQEIIQNKEIPVLENIPIIKNEKIIQQKEIPVSENIPIINNQEIIAQQPEINNQEIIQNQQIAVLNNEKVMNDEEKNIYQYKDIPNVLLLNNIDQTISLENESLENFENQAYKMIQLKPSAMEKEDNYPLPHEETIISIPEEDTISYLQQESILEAKNNKSYINLKQIFSEKNETYNKLFGDNSYTKKMISNFYRLKKIYKEEINNLSTLLDETKFLHQEQSKDQQYFDYQEILLTFLQKNTNQCLSINDPLFINNIINNIVIFINEEIHSNINNFHNLYKNMINNPKETNYNVYNEYKNQIKNLILGFLNYFQLVNKNYNQKVYKIIPSSEIANFYSSFIMNLGSMDSMFVNKLFKLSWFVSFPSIFIKNLSNANPNMIFMEEMSNLMKIEDKIYDIIYNQKQIIEKNNFKDIHLNVIKNLLNIMGQIFQLYMEKATSNRIININGNEYLSLSILMDAINMNNDQSQEILLDLNINTLINHLMKIKKYFKRLKKIRALNTKNSLHPYDSHIKFNMTRESKTKFSMDKQSTHKLSHDDPKNPLKLSNSKKISLLTTNKNSLRSQSYNGKKPNNIENQSIFSSVIQSVQDNFKLMTKKEPSSNLLDNLIKEIKQEDDIVKKEAFKKHIVEKIIQDLNKETEIKILINNCKDQSLIEGKSFLNEQDLTIDKNFSILKEDSE